MRLKKCNGDGCEAEDRQKNLKKIRGEWYCKKCAANVRKEHREQTIENAGIRGDIQELDRKLKREYNRTRYKKLNPEIKRRSKKFPEEFIPIMRGVKSKVKNKSNSYLLLDEKRLLFGRLIKKGFTEDEARERIKILIDNLRKIRMGGADESKLLIKKANLMEGLINC